MSAVFGIYGEAGAAELHKMSARLAHRGAQQALWSVTSQVHLGVRCLATTRMSPLPVACAGALDNRSELLALLRRNPDDCHSNEAELLRALYERYGVDGFARIRGQFVAALWDEHRQRLLLVCDPVAIRLLFITQTRERYAFATEYKALLALEDVAARPNRDAIQHLQATKQLFPGGSLLEGIRPLKPGSCLELGGPVPVEHCYRPLALRVQRGTRATHAASLQESLLQAARRQTQDHPELGIALSAGLDSAVVVGAVKHVAPHSRLHTFTAGHSTGDPDLAAAAAVAREFDTDHHEVLLAPDDLPQLLPQVVWHIEDPIGREEMVFWYLIAQQAARYVPTLLCGNLADLLFGGMPRFKVVHAAAHFRWLGPALEEFYNCTQTGHRPASACARLFTQAYYRKMPTSVPTVRDAHAALEYTRFDLKSNDPLNALLVAGLQGQPNPNATCERLYGSAGLTYNSPFYDLDVVDCAFRIPGALKIRGLQQKHILRRAARAFVPRHILERPKGLLRLARNERLSQVLSEMAEQYLNDRAVAERGLFDVQQIRRLREPSNGVYSEDQLYRVWTLLLTEMWAIRFLDHRGARHADEGMQESQIEAIKAMPR